jgi:AcrR family transcriptional regulator
MSANRRSSAARAGSRGTSGARYRRLNPGVPRRRLKRTQRERLIDAMIELAAQRGYAAVSITELCSHAGVSPVTFYERFEGKEECFLAAYRHCGERMFARMRALAADAHDWSALARLALDELLRGLQRDPDAGRLLFIEALGGGPLIRAERDRVLLEFERAAEGVLARTPQAAQTVDVPPMAVIGALRHVISGHLRTNAEDQLPSLLDDGLSWLSGYALPGASARWSTSPAALLEHPPQSQPPAAWAPEPLPPGTSGLSAGVIARSQRTRLINAIAEVSMAKGWANTKIADIVTAARVGRPVFYEHFADKEDGFLEAQQHPTQHILDRCAQAYFSAEEWPERIWRCLRTLTGLIVENPAISHLRLVECYAAGPKAIRRAEEITRSFTIFFEEGYRYRADAASLPRLCSQAVTGAIFEIIQRDVADHQLTRLATRLPQLTYLAIAPYTGAQHAITLVEEIKARERPPEAVEAAVDAAVAAQSETGGAFG